MREVSQDNVYNNLIANKSIDMTVTAKIEEMNEPSEQEPDKGWDNRGLYTPPHIPRGVCAESEDCPRTKFGQILAEIPAKFENPSPNLVRGQS